MIHFCIKIRKKYMCSADTPERQQDCCFFEKSKDDYYCKFNREFHNETPDDVCRSIDAKSFNEPGRDLIGLKDGN
jgi:hypothetical protein